MAPSQAAPPPTVPFTRILVHHNKVVDSLLNVDDFGGIETWQGGPAYVYDNISGNPGGYRNWDHVLNPNTEARFRPRLLPGRGLQELSLQQHRLGQIQRPGRQAGQHGSLPGNHQLPEHFLQ